MAEDEERLRRFTRLLKLNTIKRATVIAQIRSTHDVALRVVTDNSLVSLYSFYVADLDSLWHEFKSFDLVVLNCLFELNRADEYSLDLHSTMRKLVDMSKTVWTQICHMGTERIIKAHPTTFESIPRTSKTVRGQCISFPSGHFSEVLPTRPSASDINSVVSRPTATPLLNRDYDMLDCNLLTFRSPLAKLVFTLGPVMRSPNFVRPCIYDLFRNGPLLPPDIICAVRAANGAHKWSLNFVKGSAVLKRVVAPPPPPVFPLHPVVFRRPTMCVQNPERYRDAYPSLSIYYLPARRRLQYVMGSPSSLRQWADVTSIVVWVIGLHKSFKKYMFNRGYQIRTLLMTGFFGQYIKSSNVDRALRGIMPIIPARLLLYWCNTHGANGDPLEWDDSSPSLSLCDLPKFLSSCITRIVDMTNQLSTRTCNIDHMLHTVVHRRRKSATRGRHNCDPSVLVVICEAWVSYILPPSNLFPYIVFDGGGRPRRLARSKRERTIYVTSISCVSQHFGHRLHRLLCSTNPCVSTTMRSASSSGQGADPLHMYELRLIIVRRKVRSDVICPWWHYYPPII